LPAIGLGVAACTVTGTVIVVGLASLIVKVAEPALTPLTVIILPATVAVALEVFEDVSVKAPTAFDTAIEVVAPTLTITDVGETVIESGVVTVIV
jgi:hypothetical protein